MNSIDIIKKDPYLDKFISDNKLTDSFVKNHINVFSRVLESRNKCVKCKGLYACNQCKVGERLDLRFDQTLLEEIEYCDYKKDDEKVSALANSLVYSDIPERFKGVTLDNLIPEEDEGKLFVTLYEIFEGKSNEGLYIVGSMGVGKTYLTIALANSLALKNEKVAFVKCSSFINEMRRLVVSDTSLFDSYMTDLQKVKYLILDDIGSESVSTFSRDDILFTLLDYRMENHLTTIFTSNLNKDDLIKHYTYDKKDNSSLLRAKRLVERIDILGKDFVLTGTNKRR